MGNLRITGSYYLKKKSQYGTFIRPKETYLNIMQF